MNVELTLLRSVGRPRKTMVYPTGDWVMLKNGCCAAWDTVEKKVARLAAGATDDKIRSSIVREQAGFFMPAREPLAFEAVKKSKSAGETACATNASCWLSMVGQAVSPASADCGRFFHSFLQTTENDGLPTGDWGGSEKRLLRSVGLSKNRGAAPSFFIAIFMRVASLAAAGATDDKIRSSIVREQAGFFMPAREPLAFEAVKKSKSAGETACATNASCLLSMVGQAV